MILLFILIPVVSSQVHYNSGIEVIWKFVECYDVPQVELFISSHILFSTSITWVIKIFKMIKYVMNTSVYVLL